MVEINGKAYDVVCYDLKCTFAKLSTDKSGRKQSGRIFIDLIGTFYNYTATFMCNGDKLDEYAEFFKVVSAPEQFVKCKFPLGQEWVEISAYTTTGDMPFIAYRNGKNFWGPVTVNFIAEEPMRRPSE